jgi:hypothetical protein
MTANVTEALKSLKLADANDQTVSKLEAAAKSNPAAVVAKLLDGLNGSATEKAGALTALEKLNIGESFAFDPLMPRILVLTADKAAPVRTAAAKVASLLVSRISPSAGKSPYLTTC